MACDKYIRIGVTTDKCNVRCLFHHYSAHRLSFNVNNEHKS